MPVPLASDFYYLTNFRTVLDWVRQRYADLLSAQEREFMQDFCSLPQLSQALLVRLVMRKGPHFRYSKLAYAEIGDIATAADPLLQHSWLMTDAPLLPDDLGRLLLKQELLSLLPQTTFAKNLSKNEILQLLCDYYPVALPYQQWPAAPTEQIFSLTITPLCERIRLLFFGNLSQSWAEFVLTDLGVFRYEQVAFSDDSRGFNQRGDIDDYLHLHRCRDAFAEGASVIETLQQLGKFQSANPWIEQGHQRLRFQLGQQLEREAELGQALQLYEQCNYAGARQRRIRILEKSQQHESAYALALQTAAAPESEAERQLVARALKRLARKLKQPLPAQPTAVDTAEQRLTMPQHPGIGVEQRVALQLSQQDAPVHYLENTLVCSLFGLLCWDAIFAPLPGAFFHPFQSAPADLHSSDFYQRRRTEFDACLARLDSQDYALHIRHTFQQKQGIQSPFVFWSLLSEELLDQALHCIPAAHLKLWFQRMLRDIRANRTGMPDLIQFWPAEQRYRMIEVKGPGDRLQDNQRRWLAFCAEHAMPVEVCYVQWADQASQTNQASCA